MSTSITVNRTLVEFSGGAGLVVFQGGRGEKGDEGDKGDQGEPGVGDMTKTVYDTDNDGRIDNDKIEADFGTFTEA